MTDQEQLPLLSRTPATWSRVARARLPEFLADHAVCEQQAALTALNLVAHYPDDFELIERMTSLAAEETIHLRRVATILRRRGWAMSRRRANPYVQELRRPLKRVQEPDLKQDRLLVAALIEARSCERFTRLLEAIGGTDPEIASLLEDLGPAELRHWRLFHELAARGREADAFDRRWRFWLEHEEIVSRRGGRSPRVHG